MSSLSYRTHSYGFNFFMECQNLTLFQRYVQFNFWDLDFYTEDRGLIFVTFSLFLPIESLILMLSKAPKLLQGCRLWIESQKNLEDINGANFAKKMQFFAKIRFIQNYTLR